MNTKTAPVLLALLLPLFQWVMGQKPAGKYYVGATAGLNLRASAATNGDRLATAQYAEAVEVLAPAADQAMTVDGIKGGMAKVSYNGKVGYMFDGYLVRFILPAHDETVEAYAGRLWSSDADVLHEEHRRDWGGYAQMEYAVHFQDMTWAEAFLIAKHLFGIPAPLQYPGDTGREVKKAVNPNKDPIVWTDELEAHYDANGRLQRIVYVHRGEGGGTSIMVEPSDDESYRFKVSSTDIAD